MNSHVFRAPVKALCDHTYGTKSSSPANTISMHAHQSIIIGHEFPTSSLKQSSPFSDPTYFFPAYIFVQLFAFFTNSFRSSRYSLPMFASTASSGTGSTSSWRANCRTAPIFELGFHSSGRSMPRHMEPFSSLDTFG